MRIDTDNSIDFYPRSPCGERRKKQKTVTISFKFLSTLSLRRATSERPGTRQPYAISIHALLAESDIPSIGTLRNTHNNFYPRSPCGERPDYFHKGYISQAISIHALLAESDGQMEVLF